MKIEYRQALFEVYKILENTDEEIKNKIPEKFIKFVKENMDTNYKFELEKGKELVRQNLKSETKQIIALIYKYYICGEEEREKIVENGKIDIRKNFYIDFNKNKKSKIKNIQNRDEIENFETSLLEMKKEKWYKKLINKILEFFQIK